jgi:hypothetical protein
MLPVTAPVSRRAPPVQAAPPAAPPAAAALAASAPPRCDAATQTQQVDELPASSKECSACMRPLLAAELLAVVPCGHRCVCARCAAVLAVAAPLKRKCPACLEPLHGALRVRDAW